LQQDIDSELLNLVVKLNYSIVPHEYFVAGCSYGLIAISKAEKSIAESFQVQAG